MNILINIYNNKYIINKLNIIIYMSILIHVGKCGGSNIVQKFKIKHNINITSIHVHNNYEIQRKNLLKSSVLCLLVRDPITRFNSIFNYWLNLHNMHEQKLKVPHIDKVLLYKKYFNIFKNPNDLSEALTHNNINIRTLALSALNTIQHFKEGFKYYLFDENTIKSNLNNFKFIIRREHYKEDFGKFYDYICNKYNIKNKDVNYFIDSPRNSTLNKKEITLSKQSITNIKSFFKEDYKILNILVKYNMISQNYIDEFI
jgi:hypothetical protein